MTFTRDANNAVTDKMTARWKLLLIKSSEVTYCNRIVGEVWINNVIVEITCILLAAVDITSASWKNIH